MVSPKAFLRTAILLGLIVSVAITEENASPDAHHVLGFEGSAVYHPDPNHIWNRLFHHLYTRTGPNAQVFGPDILDPLLWVDTDYLIQGESYDEALILLDEFLSTNAAQLIDDPLKKAMFQRDLWAVFDWLEVRRQDQGVIVCQLECPELQARLVQIIQHMALSEEAIAALPDNYQDALDAFPDAFQPDAPTMAYLPPDLFNPAGSWVNIGREGGPIAMTHVSEFLPFNGRSSFLVFLQLPDGRQATLDYLDELQQTHPTNAPPLPPDSQVALVRQMLVISDQGKIVPAPITLSFQLRHFRISQVFFESDLSRKALFASDAGGLRALMPGEEGFRVFIAAGDLIEDFPEQPELWQGDLLRQCSGCHERQATQIESVISYSRDSFQLADDERVRLIETTPTDEAAVTIEWKLEQENWARLQIFWK